MKVFGKTPQSVATLAWSGSYLKVSAALCELVPSAIGGLTGTSCFSASVEETQPGALL